MKVSRSKVASPIDCELGLGLQGQHMFFHVMSWLQLSHQDIELYPANMRSQDVALVIMPEQIDMDGLNALAAKCSDHGPL